MTKRLEAMGLAKYEGLINPGKGHFNGTVRTHAGTLEIPLQRKSPTVYFVNSMSDLFHKNVPDSFILRVFEVMLQCPQHTFQILTKRPQRMSPVVRRVLQDLAERSPGSTHDMRPPPNIWLGTSVEDQSAAQDRIPALAETPASVRFLSCEPLLGPISDLDLFGIHWVIVGGESGPGARPMKRGWVEGIKSQCRDSNVPFFFKQWGGPRKKVTGRELHGQTWDEMPDVRYELSAVEQQGFRDRLHRVRDRIAERESDASIFPFLRRQEDLTDFGWLWKSDLPAIDQLFRRYGVG